MAPEITSMPPNRTPPAFEHIERPEPRGELIAIFVLPLELLPTTNKTRGTTAWQAAKRKKMIATLLMVQARFKDHRHKGKGKGKGKEDKKSKLPTHDHYGKKIDRTPPRTNEPHTRTNSETGVEEKWCGKCGGGVGRWGNHLTAKHDEWKQQRDEFYRRQNQQRSDQEQSGDSTAQNADQGGGSPLRMPRSHFASFLGSDPF